MTGSPMTAPRRIMHRWRQRMSGIELTILFSLTACGLLLGHDVKSLPVSLVPGVSQSIASWGIASPGVSSWGVSLWLAAAVTLSHVFLAFFLALVASLLLAAIASQSCGFRAILVPTLSVARSVPGLGLVGFVSALCPPDLTIPLVAASNLIWQLATALLDAEDTLPTSLEAVALGLRMTGWQRFWRLRVPVAVPLCAYRTLQAMPGFWTRLLAAEALALLMGATSGHVEGCGALVLDAVLHHHTGRIAAACVVAFLIVALVDQTVIAPLDGWAQRYRLDDGTQDDHDARNRSRSLVLRAWRRSRILMRVSSAVSAPLTALGTLRLGRLRQYLPEHSVPLRDGNGPLLPALSLLAVLTGLYFDGMLDRVPVDVLHGALTLAHVSLTLLLCCVLWVPLGVLLGRRSAMASSPLRIFIAVCRLFPAILLYPLCRELGLNSASFLLFLGAHWLVAGVVLDGVSNIPAGLLQVAAGLRLRGTLLWRRLLLPAIAPDLCAGLLMAVAPVWNAVMVAEAFVPSDRGLGAILMADILAGNLPAQCLCLMMLTLLSLLLDRLILQPLAVNAAQKYTV